MRCFFKVVLPNAFPGIVATIIFAFLLAWRDLLWALCLTSDESLQTVTLAASRLIGQFYISWGEIMAGLIIASFPPIVLYLLLQRYLVKGLTTGAVKR